MASSLDQFTGVDPDAIAYTESRGMGFLDKLFPGKNGEIGKYQITPLAFADLQRLNPSYKSKNFYATAAVDPWAKQAMQDYMLQLHQHYGLNNPDAVVQAYNIGPTAYKKGKRNPKYLKTYQEGLSQ